MPDSATAGPAICLNMIVKNEAHIVHEALDSVAPYISTWVIVDTGSDDGTQDLIRTHMAGLGIPGELHERPWHNFGHNRTEALTLAQGHGDYIWVMDADDILVGTPDLTQLSADIYQLRRLMDSNTIYWQPQLFRDGLRVRYQGVTHEFVACDDPYAGASIEGEYHIEDRQLSARNTSGQKLARDRDLLLAEVERNPEDARSTFYLASSYFDLGDFANARTWFARRVSMGGWDEEVYLAMWRMTRSMAELGAPWPEIQDASLNAWQFRPTRAEPLYALACRYRENRRHRLGYLFAKLAAEIPYPEHDTLFVPTEVYAWRAADEQAVCAAWIDKQAEAFMLWRGILGRPDIPDEERPRISGNRDVCVPTMLEAASSYPEALVQSLLTGTGSGEPEIVVSLIAGPDRHRTEQTLNSFLHCCTDVSRVGRFLALDTGLTPEDRATLQQRYGFLEFADPGPADQPELTQIRAQITGRFWLHLGQGWRFFAPENFITRLTAVLDAEPQVSQVGINYTDAAHLTATSAPETAIRRAPDAGRYLLADTVATGPAMTDTTRRDQPSGTNTTATLDEILCITAT